jgi:L-rhamnose mutarotase
VTESRMHCFIYRLASEAGPEYDARHAEVWPEMRQLLAAEGIHDYRIFRRGDLVISVLRSTDDFAETRARLAASAVQQRWSASLAHLFAETQDERGLPLFAEEVFRHDVDGDA